MPVTQKSKESSCLQSQREQRENPHSHSKNSCIVNMKYLANNLIINNGCSSVLDMASIDGRMAHAFHMVHLTHVASLPNQFLLRNDAEWGMFKMPFWLPQTFGSPVERPDTSKVRLPLNALPLLLSAFTRRQTACWGPRTYHRKRDTNAGVFEISAKCEHNWISVCERYLWRLPCSLGENKNDMDECKTCPVLQQVKNHAGTTLNHMIHI